MATLAQTQEQKMVLRKTKPMLVEHRMAKDWVGAADGHPHDQAIYVVSGRLRATGGGQTFVFTSARADYLRLRRSRGGTNFSRQAFGAPAPGVPVSVTSQPEGRKLTGPGFRVSSACEANTFAGSVSAQTLSCVMPRRCFSS
jgi:hypothetical protein